MQVVNEMRNYFNKLVRDTKNPEIKYFSNIELGKNYDNPHLHIQLWFNNEKQITKIYKKVIEKFGLFSEFCKLNISKDNENKFYDYAIKDYAKNMSNERILELDIHRREYRAVLGKNFRFSSHTSGEHTKLIYKRLYAKGIKRENVDFLLKNCVIDNVGNIVDSRVVLYVLLHLVVNILNKTKIKSQYWYLDDFEDVKLLFFFKYWIYGFIDQEDFFAKINKNKLKRICRENI